MKIIFATHNPGKLKEIRHLLSGLKVDVLSAEEVGVVNEPEEDGKTFLENSLKKARYVVEQTGEWAVADDSGICIEALGGKPGVYSARWAGNKASDQDKVNLVLAKTRSIPDNQRQAWMECAVVLMSPDGAHWEFIGRVDGNIITETRGKPRPKLLYDLIFIPLGEQLTFAEMSDEEKNKISHRGIAFAKLKGFLLKKIQSV